MSRVVEAITIALVFIGAFLAGIFISGTDWLE